MNLNLYIDAGNTYVKIGYFEEKWKVFKMMTKTTSTASILQETLQHFLLNIEPEKIYISSVVSEIDEVIKEWNRNNFQAKLIFLSGKSKLPLKINQEAKNSIGSDIVANCYYASLHYQEAIVISLGTATVISHIKNNRLMGSVITAGLMSTFYFLSKSASRLNSFSLRYIENKIVANNTQDALSLGFVNGFVYMIKEFIQKINPNAQVLLTGGDSHYVIQHLKALEINHMVLKGLKAYGENHVSK